MSRQGACDAPRVSTIYGTVPLGNVTVAPLPRNARGTLKEAYFREGARQLNQTREAWHRIACPWEEIRHSGFFNHFVDTELAMQYAEAGLPCSERADRDRDKFARGMAGRRFMFVGDSVIRQFSQAFLCRLRASLRVVRDDMTWIRQWPSNKWGHCNVFSSIPPHPGGLQHCYMEGGCVSFEGDVHVCYMQEQKRLAHYISISDEPFQRIAQLIWQPHGIGVRTYMVAGHGMHEQRLTAHSWRQVALKTPKIVQRMLSKNNISRSQFTFVYKELDATHFPAKSGLYMHYAYNRNRSKWHCAPVRPHDPLPPLRQLELQEGLPAIRGLARTVPVHILRTFATGLADGARLHSTYASMPGHGNQSIDCLHWMMPGVPDLWVEQLLAVALHARKSLQVNTE